jgi:predicted PhzF superfamily epimerase YddE/YHI9
MRIFLVDSFASGPFTGNPAAVCPLEAEPSAEWMQQVAMEMNQAETAFFWPRADGYGLRWFTPAVEVDLCGHATLASAHVMFASEEEPATGAAREDARPPGELRFHTRSGLLTCRRAGDAIAMDFPSEAPTEVDAFSVVDALGVQPVWMGANRMDWFFELASVEELLALEPDMAKVKALGKRGVVVTAGAGSFGSSEVRRFGSEETPTTTPAPTVSPPNPRTSEPPNFVSRFFAPQSGIDEDPVTGSAHCALGPYWAGKLGRTSVVGYQASKRGGFIRIDVHGDRVVLTGQAVTTLVGELRV